MRAFFFILSILSFISTGLAEPRQDYLKNLEEIRRELKQKKKEVKKATRREKSILSIIDGLDAEISKLSIEEEQVKEEVKGVHEQIDDTQVMLKKINTEIDAGEKRFDMRIISFFKSQQSGYLPVIMGASDMQDLLIRHKFLDILIKQDRDFLAKLKHDRETQTSLLVKLKNLQDELYQREKELSKRKDELLSKKNEKNVILSKIRNEKELYRRAIEELEESSKEIERVINEFRKQSPTTSDVQFMARKGKLNMPADGRIVKSFGMEIDPRFHTVIYRKGIVIDTIEGAEIRCIYPGTVVFSGSFSGYGNILIVKHGNNFYSIYAHLSRILKRVGEGVEEGDLIGYSGATGTLSDGGLYFELRQGGTPLNPEEWLRLP